VRVLLRRLDVEQCLRLELVSSPAWSSSSSRLSRT
jgi:hypothetical protein